MSGSRGNPPQGAPSRTLLQVPVVVPWVDERGYLTAWAAQFLERMAHYLGSPTDSSSGTISSQVSSNSTAIVSMMGGSGVDAATLQQIAELDQALSILPLPPLPPSPAAPAPLSSFVPGAPAIPQLAAFQLWAAGQVSALGAGLSIASSVLNATAAGTVPSVTATGATLGTAAALTAKNSNITAGAAGTGVRLLSASLGLEQRIFNRSGSAKNIWPASASEQIEAAGLGASVNLASGSSALYVPVSSVLVLSSP